MSKFRVTVDYGDDRIRTYSVEAETLTEAEVITLTYITEQMLTICAADDHEDWNELDFDGEL